MEVEPSNTLVASTSPTDGALKDYGQPPIPPPQQAVVDASTPPSSPIVHVPACERTTCSSSNSDLDRRQINLPTCFKDYQMT